MSGTRAPCDVDIVVVGAGIAGLTAAFLLDRAGCKVRVLESSNAVGGAIHTVRRDGFLVECGPNTVLDTHPAVRQLLEMAGLAGERMAASPEAKSRYVVRNGRLVAVPTTPREMLTTPLFSRRARLRLLAEPLIPRGWGEESVAEFVRRRLGREFLDYAVDPFVSGVYAGRPEELSVRHAFPRLAEVEEEYGSLILGQIRGARKRAKRADTPKARAEMFTLRDGLERLPQRLARDLDVRLEARVQEVRTRGGKWHISHTRGSVQADHMIVASGLRGADWWAGFGADVETLKEVDYPPLVVHAIGFRRSDVAHPMDGFGVLIPRVERRDLLGALFTSQLFPGRAPEDHVLITAFTGGARSPELAALPPEELRGRVLHDLTDLLGVSAEPVFEHTTRWPHAIPQYNLHYGRVKAELDRLESAHRGLHFAGNYRAGISVPDTIRHAFSICERLRPPGTPSPTET